MLVEVDSTGEGFGGWFCGIQVLMEQWRFLRQWRRHHLTRQSESFSWETLGLFSTRDGGTLGH